MIQKILPTVFLLSVIVTAPAGAESLYDDTEDPQGSQPFDIYGHNENVNWPAVTLTTREQEAVILSQGWQNRYSPAMLGDNGKVVYHFGESSAPVITSPGNVTQIQLEPGEVLVERGIFIGDTVNWRIIPVVQGKGENIVTHIVVKPTYRNLETTMIAITDRRSYYFHLKSTEAQFMSSVGFEYPKIEKQYWDRYTSAVNARERERDQRTTIQPTPEIEQNIAELDFRYRISGNSPKWKPVRVYNDGRQVYIQMPRAMQQSDAPAFVELGKGDAAQIVNYRLRQHTYVVDKLFERGMLITGTGRKQRKVIIAYEGEAR